MPPSNSKKPSDSVRKYGGANYENEYWASGWAWRSISGAGRSNSMGWCAAKIPQNAPSLVSVGTAMGWSMSTRCERPWPAIDLAELRYCLAFGSSVEEMADFLHRDVEDVRHQIAVEAQRVASQRPH